MGTISERSMRAGLSRNESRVSETWTVKPSSVRTRSKMAATCLGWWPSQPPQTISAFGMRVLRNFLGRAVVGHARVVEGLAAFVSGLGREKKKPRGIFFEKIGVAD